MHSLSARFAARLLDILLSHLQSCLSILVAPMGTKGEIISFDSGLQ